MKNIKPKQVMKKSIILSLGLILLFLQSCVTLTSTSSSAKTMDLNGAGVIHLPIIVELEIHQEPHTTIIKGKEPDIVLLEMVLVTALKETNADIFLVPSYTIERQGADKTVTLKGYPAFYKHFRTIEKDDVILLEIGHTQQK